MTPAKETAKNLWVIGSNGEVRVGDEAALAREVKRALDGKDLSRNFMTACADLFFQVLDGEYGFVPEGELSRTMGAAARIHVLTALANELATSIKDGEEMRERWHVECAPVGRVCAAGGGAPFCCGEWCFRVIVGVNEWKHL